MIRSFNSYDKTVIVIAEIAPFIIKKTETNVLTHHPIKS